jgi:hypothetical protein
MASASPAALRVFRMLGKTVVEGSLLDHLDRFLLDHLDRFLLDHPDGTLLDQVVLRGNQTR